jgi:membrane protein YdbS with pleckstrin-like domain
VTAPRSVSTGWQQPSPRLRSMRRAQFLLTLGVLALPGALAAVLLGQSLIAAAVVALAVIGALTVWTVTARQWRAWGYAEREADLLVRHGVLVRRLSVVPYGRMQFVDVTAGPVDRWLGLATVHMHTAAAASDARIPGLPTAEAARLRDRLATLGEARAAGL